MYIDKIAFIHIKNQRVLMAQNFGKDVYYIPGGKREPGETDEQALIREVDEELSVKVMPGTVKYLGTFEEQAHGKPQGVIIKMTCYIADFGGEPKPGAEIQDIAYYAYEQRKIVAPADQAIFDHLKNLNLIA